MLTVWIMPEVEVEARFRAANGVVTSRCKAALWDQSRAPVGSLYFGTGVPGLLWDRGAAGVPGVLGVLGVLELLPAIKCSARA